LPGILDWISKRKQRKRNAHNLYGSIVALSRSPVLYSDLCVPDTLEGRFELLVLHVFVFLDRLRSAGVETRPLAQEVVDLFFKDMDTTSREVGVGDLVVPKKMRKLAVVFGERMAEYENAMSHSDSSILAKELEQNIFFDDGSGTEHAALLAKYVLGLTSALAQTPIGDLGQVHSRLAGIQG